MMQRRAVAIVVLSVCALVSAGCGQKEGVHVATANGVSAGAAGDSSGGAVDSSGQATGTDSANGAGTSSASGAGAGTGASSGASGASSDASGGTGRSGGTAAAAAGGAGPADRTGVTDDTITIGIHAPATGAGAPAPSFDKGKDKYFQFIGKAINGRAVKVVFQDDGYNPSQAVASCKKMVQESHVFMLVGGGGTDQIVACAQYAASVGVPYVAEGVTESGVNKLASYFAESMSYKQQGVLLAQYIKSKGFTQVAMVRGNTANFEDAHSGFIAAAQQAGLTIKKDLAINKDATAAEASSAAQQVCSSVAPTDQPKLAVYPLMSPKLFISFAGAAAQQQCFPRYAGVGVTLGLNVVAQALCPTGALKTGATFFSPYQGLDVANSVDPDFLKAYPDGDDIGFALWGAEKLLAAQLKVAGRDLSRQSFVASVQGKTFSTGVYPTVNYAGTRFGGTAVHVLKADCGKSQYVTESQNNKGF